MCQEHFGAFSKEVIQAHSEMVPPEVAHSTGAFGM